MSIFGDKEQEIKQLINYIKEIVDSSNPKWHVTPGSFSLTIQGAINRRFSRAELESYEKQIKYLKVLEENFKKQEKSCPLIDNNLNSFDNYLKVIENIRNRSKIYTYDFCSVHDPTFEGDQYNYIEKMNKKPLTRKQRKSFLFPSIDGKESNSTDELNFGPKDYYSFGKYILNNGINESNQKNEADNTLFTLFNTFGRLQPDQEIVDKFIDNLYEKRLSIDPYKVGREFVDFLNKELKEKPVIIPDLRNFKFKGKSKENLSNFINRFTDDQTLLIANVPNPGHTFHLIQPSYFLWCQKKGREAYRCPQNNILFCTENNNFQGLLTKLTYSTDNDLHFIIHPENLRSDEMQHLKTYVSAQRSKNVKQTDDQNKKKKKEATTVTPRIMIITSLNPSYFNLDDKSDRDFKDSQIFGRDDIKEFATFNAKWRRTVCKSFNDVFLFSSDQPGKGKTYRINEIIDKAVEKYFKSQKEEELEETDENKKIEEEKEEKNEKEETDENIKIEEEEEEKNEKEETDENIKIEEKEEDDEKDKKEKRKDIKEKRKIYSNHIYFDITTEEIPESIIDKYFIHVSISPELFLNNFLIFDQLYLLIQYGYFTFKSGQHISYSPDTDVVSTFLIEIPNLDKDDIKNFYDFPIAPSNNEEEWENDIYKIVTEEFADIEDKNKDFQNGWFHLSGEGSQIAIKDKSNVKKLMRLIFTDYEEITTYKKLIVESKNLFFIDEVEDSSFIDDNRIISKVKQMIEDYSALIIREYESDIEMQKKLFLLTLRTVLYIWHFTPKTRHSIILLVPQRLMTIDAFKKLNGWIFVGFCSKRDKNQEWNKGKNIISDVNSDYDLIKKISNDFQNNENIHILSEYEPLQNDDTINNDNNINLQTQFFKAILLFLPEINFTKSSSNPLNIASILLSLFSNMKHFPQSSFKSIITDLCDERYSIEDCKKKYRNGAYAEFTETTEGAETTEGTETNKIKGAIEWTEMDELLTYYLRNNKINPNRINNINDLILQLKSELGNHENIWNIIKISFSKTYFARFIEIILKVYYRHFTILQGDTGCGKTSVVHLLDDVISLAKSDPQTRSDIRWNFLMIDFHGNYLQDDFDKEIKYIRTELSMDVKETEDNKYNEKVIIFLDEVNTSPAYYYVIDHIQNSVSEYFAYIGAVNAHIKLNEVSRKLSRVGIPQYINRQLSKIKLFSPTPKEKELLTEDYDVNEYAYNVKEAQKSVDSAIINADPQEFDEVNPNFAEFFPDEEKSAIRSIVTKILLQWDNNTSIDLTNTIDLLSELISLIFKSVRSFLKLRAIFSYRDVHRCITIFTYIFDYFKKHNLEDMIKSDNNEKLKEDKSNLMNKITSISVVIAIYISLVSRFSHEDVDTDNNILNRFIDHPFRDPSNPNPSKICMYRLVLNYISKESNWPSKTLPYIKDWEHISILLAYAKCMKYVINEKKKIYPLPSLMLHLLILSLTVSASFKDINSNKNKKLSLSSSDFFTSLIIGMPGTSKSKAVEIFKKYHLRPPKEKGKKHEYFITTYLCSRTSDSDSLLAQFLNGAWFLNEKSSSDSNSKKSIVILEEVGLANYNPSRPLKILHPLCDKGVQIRKEGHSSEYCKIIPIQLSNYQIDFANMNRGFLVCAGLPTDGEFYSSIAFGKILKKKKIKEPFINKNFSKLVLYRITQIDEPIADYEKTIDILIDTILKKSPDIYDEIKQFNKEVLKALWDVTQESKSRPYFYPMRPLFDLINEVDDLKYIIENPDPKNKAKDEEDIFDILQKITSILNSFTHSKQILDKVYNPEITVEKTSAPKKGKKKKNQAAPPQTSEDIMKEPLLYQFLNLLDLQQDKSVIDSINSVTLYRSFIDDQFDKKAILIRTQNYEAFRYLPLLNENEDENLIFYNFIPFKFQDVGQDCQDKFDILFDEIFNSLKNTQEEENVQNHIFCSVGNDPFSDYIIDILNSINQEGQCPTAILKGFPVYLPRFPPNIKFIFIINENEIYNHELRNPVPYPLIDRLSHLFLNKQILKAFNTDLPDESCCNQLKVKYLLDLPISGKEEEKIKKSKKNSKESYLLTYDKSDFQYLLDAIQEKEQAEGQKILDNHFKNTFVRSLNDLIKKMRSQSNDDSLYSTAIVFTRTPVYETVFFDDMNKFLILNTDDIDEINTDTFEIDNDETNNDETNTVEIKKPQNVLISSDVFNIPDDDTINNALSVVNGMQRIINIVLSLPEDKLNTEEKLCFIIVFHINENRIPSEFGTTAGFPVVWIDNLAESLQDSPKDKAKDSVQTGALIQEICNAVLNGQLAKDSPLFNRIYTKISNDVKSHLEKDQQKKVDDLFQNKGIKLEGSKKPFTINSIIDILPKSTNDQDAHKQVSFDLMKKDLLSKIEKIKKNLKDEIDEKTKMKNDKIYNDELYNFNLEINFFSTISTLADKKVNATLSIVIKYFTVAKKVRLENVKKFITDAYDNVVKFSNISFIKEITLDTFSNKNNAKEINAAHPELLFVNILKEFFNNDNYYNSLNKMKILVKNLSSLKEIQISDLFKYINENYYLTKPGLPYDQNCKLEDEITIDIFNDFLNYRGLIIKNKSTKAINNFNNQTEGNKRPNLYSKEIQIENIKSNIGAEKWGDVQYKQILVSDCINNFMNTCNANDNPHPIIIYEQFLNNNSFSLYQLDNDEVKEKIYPNNLIPWIISFFVYGSFNDCKHPGKDSNYINNLIDFLSIAYKYDASNVGTMLSTSTDLKHFIYDYLFSEYCKNKPVEKIDSFAYLDHIKTDNTPLKQLVETYPDILTKIDDSNLTKDVLKTEVSLNKRVKDVPGYDSENYDPTKYDPSIFVPFSDESIKIIKDNFKNPIDDIDKAIQIYDSWKSKNRDDLGNKSIFENIRSNLFKDSDDLDNKFGIWFLNSEIPLLARQVYEICKAIKEDKKDIYEAEFKILSRIINPWNDDQMTTLFFWEWFVVSIEAKTFTKLSTFLNLLQNTPIKVILTNCFPYYFCQYNENDASGTSTTKRCIISKRTEIKTFFIERLLYTNTIIPTTSDNTEKVYLNQMFRFISHLPFVKHTKHLYILSGFVNEIMRDFRDQINLLFLIINSYQNCIDLFTVNKIQTLINDPNRTESPDLLKQALESADKYNKGENAAEKLKSYINKLIEINNSTFLLSDQKKKIDNHNIQFRLVAKGNVHPNVSLMNTFLPALVHLKLNTGEGPFKPMLNAFRILTKAKNFKNFVNDEPFFAALPSVFDFAEHSDSLEIFKNIEEIKNDQDLFGFLKFDLAKSLCNEIIEFLSNESNNSSYRAKIWEMIKNTEKPEKRPSDFSKVLDTLIPLFEEFDESILNEHLFFEWQNNSMPDKLEGVEAASYFIKSYKIDEKTIFDTIEEGLKK